MLYFPIDDKGRTFSYTQYRMVKLSPAMQRLVRALNEHGNVDPIRDCGRGTGVNTVVALMDRGILREAKRSHGVHQVATRPEQVWYEALEADDAFNRIAAKYAAGVDMDAIHATALYENALREIDDAAQEQATSRYLHFAAAVLEGKSYRAALDILHSEALSEDYWRTYPVTATEAAKASPRMLGFSRQAMIANGDMDRAHAEARAEYREVTRAAREADSAAYQRSLVRDLKGDGGWGQPDGMLGTIEADQPTANPYSPVASPRAYDLWEADRLLRADLTAARADGIALPIVPAPREAALRAAAELRSMINGETISDNVLRRALREQLRRLDKALSAIPS